MPLLFGPQEAWLEIRQNVAEDRGRPRTQVWKGLKESPR